jgi:hypothetical protein
VECVAVSDTTINIKLGETITQYIAVDPANLLLEALLD